MYDYIKIFGNCHSGSDTIVFRYPENKRCIVSRKNTWNFSGIYDKVGKELVYYCIVHLKGE